MSKTTKKKLRKTALKLLPAIYSDAMQTGEESGLFQHEDWRTGLCLDAFLLADAFEKAAAYRNTDPKTQLKTLDQSVFDGLEEKWRFAAVDGCTGRAYVYEQNPHFLHGKDYWRIHEGLQHIVGHGYDASNWQNSLIERDDIAKKLAEVDLSSELTGGDLCRAMLARGDKYVMCKTNDNDFIVISGTYEADDDNDAAFVSTSGEYTNVMPINNQGEPLTASEVGL